MNERNVPQWQRVVDRPEALKFVALLVVTLIALLVLAAASPWLIGRLAPTVLGLDGLPEALPGQAVQEAPVVEPNVLGEPEPAPEMDGAAAPEGAARIDVEVVGLRHEVQPGQTLFQIAEFYGVSVEEIAAANHLVNPLQLQAGTILIIPEPE
ncbi:MAG: LysM domain-containing protein [Chloroflexota bacterium]